MLPIPTRRSRRGLRLAALAMLCLAATAHAVRAAEPLAFEVTYTPEVNPGPISTRVYVMLGTGEQGGEPRHGPNWFNVQPFFAIDARDWKPGEPLRIGQDALGFPGPLADLKPGTYRAQAVIRLNPDTHDIGDGEGNAYGPVVELQVGPDQGGVVPLKVDQIVPPRPFQESERLKLVDIPSPILSAFYKRPIRQRAAIIRPEGAGDEKRPTVYIIPGFGGSHHMASHFLSGRTSGLGSGMNLVVLDPDCGTGHHVFADSATNGPRGKALTEELIPYIEAHFPAIAEPGARLLNGHSSGGWSSLWLQVSYPDYFGGTWSTSPDPVDFHDFQQIDIYAKDANVFRDAEGNRRPIARMGERPALWYDDFSHMEEVMGDGGQLGSFEAVFSPVGPDGRPREMWDRKTGAVDPEVAEAWMAYDINHILTTQHEKLAPKLGGKIHIIVGGLDTFYLEGAVAKLKESIEPLYEDVEIEIIPGKDHGSVLTPDVWQRIDREMHETVTKYLPEPEKADAAAR